MSDTLCLYGSEMPMYMFSGNRMNVGSPIEMAHSMVTMDGNHGI